MRISNLGRYQQLLRDLGLRTRALEQAQHQQATGKRFERPSEDPTAATEVLRTAVDLGAIAQYRKNAAAVTANLAAEDAAADTLNSLLATAKNAAIGAASSQPGDPVRVAALSQIELLIQQTVDLANTRVGRNYIFGGYRIDAPPIRATPGAAGLMGTTVASTEATIGIAAGAAPGVYRLTNDPAAPGSVTLTSLSDPTRSETITGVTGGTTTLDFTTLGITLTLGPDFTVATGTAAGSLDGDTIAVADGFVHAGDGRRREIEVDEGRTFVTNHTADALFGDALAALQGLRDALASGDTVAVNAAIVPVDAAQTRALGLQTESGAVVKQLGELGDALTVRETTLLDRRRAAEEIAPEEAAVRLLHQQAMLETAYAATGRVLSLTLSDYL